jgi:hypothetical protein
VGEGIVAEIIGYLVLISEIGVTRRVGLTSSVSMEPVSNDYVTSDSSISG